MDVVSEKKGNRLFCAPSNGARKKEPEKIDQKNSQNRSFSPFPGIGIKKPSTFLLGERFKMIKPLQLLYAQA